MSPPPANELDDRPLASHDPNPPTFAAFSPTSSISAAPKQRSTILVHRKSPLLVATPPAVTRALAFSHPFILPLSQVVGLVTWSTGDPWESFLLVAGFWALTLYGEEAIKWAGPILLVTLIILGMYSRRYSPLSSTGWNPAQQQANDKKKAPQQESNAKHQKSLDEILDTMNTFTARCNTLMEPFMQFTDFLSTQRTATSATTRPALTSLFIRILFITPVWLILMAPPLYILTVRLVILTFGTIALSWHSRPARVTRTILWRSQLVRRLVSLATGLNFVKLAQDQASLKRPRTQQDVANFLSSSEPSGVRFTFVVFENQRRWLGIGWTTTLLAYERAAWTDEHLNASDSKDNFKLPEVEHGSAHWRWVKGSEWQVEGAGKSKTSAGGDGWIYYDNKWMDGRRGQDGWGRYTRRRKWYRDAELVETTADSEKEQQEQQQQQQRGDESNTGLKSTISKQPTPATPMSPPTTPISKTNDNDSASIMSTSQPRKRGSWFRTSKSSTPSGGGSAGGSGDFSGSERSTLRATDDEDVPELPPGSKEQQARDWEIDDDVKMGLG